MLQMCVNTNVQDVKVYGEPQSKSTNLFFCLKCSDWITNKEAVLDQGWTLFDEAGLLRQDICMKLTQNNVT